MKLESRFPMAALVFPSLWSLVCCLEITRHGYSCDKVTDRCHRDNHYCFEKNGYFLPCHLICPPTDDRSSSMEKCRSWCAVYFDWECRPAVPAQLRVPSVPPSTSQLTPARLSAPVRSPSTTSLAPALSKEEIAAVVCGISVAVSVLVILIVIWCKRRKSTGSDRDGQHVEGGGASSSPPPTGSSHDAPTSKGYQETDSQDSAGDVEEVAESCRSQPEDEERSLLQADSRQTLDEVSAKPHQRSAELPTTSTQPSAPTEQSTLLSVLTYPVAPPEVLRHYGAPPETLTNDCLPGGLSSRHSTGTAASAASFSPVPTEPPPTSAADSPIGPTEPPATSAADPPIGSTELPSTSATGSPIGPTGPPATSAADPPIESTVPPPTSAADPPIRSTVPPATSATLPSIGPTEPPATSAADPPIGSTVPPATSAADPPIGPAETLSMSAADSSPEPEEPPSPSDGGSSTGPTSADRGGAATILGDIKPEGNSAPFIINIGNGPVYWAPQTDQTRSSTPDRDSNRSTPPPTTVAQQVTTAEPVQEEFHLGEQEVRDVAPQPASDGE